MKLLLLRDKKKQITTHQYGKIIVNDSIVITQTIERPWIEDDVGRAGKPYESCIPEGLYGLQPFLSERFKDREGKRLQTFAFENADLGVFSHHSECDRDRDRFACLLHAANWASQLNGCTAPGFSRAVWNDPRNDNKPMPVVTSSKNALHDLLAHIAKANHEVNTMEIRYANS